MRRFLQVVSWCALVATITPPLLFLGGRMTLDETKFVMLLATLAWFAATPFWMGRKDVSNVSPI